MDEMNSDSVGALFDRAEDAFAAYPDVVDTWRGQTAGGDHIVLHTLAGLLTDSKDTPLDPSVVLSLNRVTTMGSGETQTFVNIGKVDPEQDLFSGEAIVVGPEEPLYGGGGLGLLPPQRLGEMIVDAVWHEGLTHQHMEIARLQLSGLADLY